MASHSENDKPAFNEPCNEPNEDTKAVKATRVRGRFHGGSGNPKGRPRKKEEETPSPDRETAEEQRSLADISFAEQTLRFFEEPMLIEKNGELSEATKLYVMLHGLYKAAAKGNASAAHRLQYWMEAAERWQANRLERDSAMDKTAEEVRAKFAQMSARQRAFYGVPADYAGSTTDWFREQLEKLTKARDEQG